MGPQGGLQAIRDSGWRAVLEPAFGGRLLAVEVEALGDGQVADTGRLHLRWASEAAGPATLVAKVGSSSAPSRRSARLTRAYEREVGFYEHLAGVVATRTPICHFAGREPVSGRPCLLLDDVPGTPGDQLEGCPPERAASVLEQIAGLHGATAASPTRLRSRLDALRLPARPAAGGLVTGPMFQRFVRRFVDRGPGTAATASTVDLLERIGRGDLVYPPVDDGPTALTHGDLRSDNVVFRDDQATLVDWQTITFSSPLADASYFLGTSLTPDDRRRHEVDLVRHYHRHLRSAGLALGWDQCWRGYRAHSLSGLVMAVVAATLVERHARGDRMFVTMLERAAAQVQDHDALPRPARPATTPGRRSRPDA
jgi:hypothetical protein